MNKIPFVRWRSILSDSQQPKAAGGNKIVFFKKEISSELLGNERILPRVAIRPR